MWAGLASSAIHAGECTKFFNVQPKARPGPPAGDFVHLQCAVRQKMSLPPGQQHVSVDSLTLCIFDFYRRPSVFVILLAFVRFSLKRNPPFE